MLEVINLAKQYHTGKSTVTALKSVNLRVDNGTTLGLIGDNGAGKTTLIKCICGLIKPSQGSVKLDGDKLDDRCARAKVGVLLEGARNLYHFLSVEDNLDYFGYLNHLVDAELTDKKDKLLALFDLEAYRKTPVNELSRGMQQKVAIMIVMMKDPEILILDEPTLGLDLVSTIKMKKLLKEVIKDTNKIMIIISHDMNLISSLCNRIVMLQKGTIVSDEKTADIITNDHYLIRVEENDDYRNELITRDIDYSFNEGVYSIDSADIRRILEFTDNDKILSIEKVITTLEDFLERRLDDGSDHKDH